MAGDVVMTPILLGLGVDEMSMGSVAVPRVKKAVQSLDYEECKVLADRCLEMDSGEQTRAILQELAQKVYPELVI
jgi:phosphotransferase system enzyme I (PtsI)